MSKTLGDITRELNEKVLSPAKAEAEKRVREATEEAAMILASARESAEKIQESAKIEAAKTLKQFQIDMDTAARNFIIMVQEKLEAAIVTPVVDSQTAAAFGDVDFLKNIITILLTEFLKKDQKNHSIELLLPKKNQEALESWFAKQFSEKASGALTVHFTDKITFGFHLGVAGEGSHFNFSTGLTEAFANFCSPRFRNHFFARQES